MWTLIAVGAGWLVFVGVASYVITRLVIRFRRLRYERDCYRTALDVLKANGYFDHKAEELVRQHSPQ